MSLNDIVQDIKYSIYDTDSTYNNSSHNNTNGESISVQTDYISYISDKTDFFMNNTELDMNDISLEDMIESSLPKTQNFLDSLSSEDDKFKEYIKKVANTNLMYLKQWVVYQNRYLLIIKNKRLSSLKLYNYGSKERLMEQLKWFDIQSKSSDKLYELYLFYLDYINLFLRTNKPKVSSLSTLITSLPNMDIYQKRKKLLLLIFLKKLENSNSDNSPIINANLETITNIIIESKKDLLNLIKKEKEEYIKNNEPLTYENIISASKLLDIIIEKDTYQKLSVKLTEELENFFDITVDKMFAIVEGSIVSHVFDELDHLINESAATAKQNENSKRIHNFANYLKGKYTYSFTKSKLYAYKIDKNNDSLNTMKFRYLKVIKVLLEKKDRCNIDKLNTLFGSPINVHTLII